MSMPVLADLVSNVKPKSKKKNFEPKLCFSCEKQWIPRSGMAAKKRDYCYEVGCEIAAQDRKILRMAEKKRAMKHGPVKM